jgi:hypothetical protein
MLKYTIFKSSFSFYLTVLGIIILNACSTIQHSERGSARSFPGLSKSIKTSANLNSSKGVKLGKNSSNIEKNGTDQIETVECVLELESQTLVNDSNNEVQSVFLSQKEIKRIKNTIKGSIDNNRLSIKQILNASNKNKVHSKPGSTIHVYNNKNEWKPDASSDAIKWVFYGLGLGLLIFLGGFGLLMGVFSIGWGEPIVYGLTIMFLGFLPGLFYLWANYLYDGLEEHSLFYKIGFWGTVTILPAIFALPIWICAAIFDWTKSGKFDKLLRVILKTIGILILAIGEAVAFVSAISYILYY